MYYLCVTNPSDSNSKLHLLSGSEEKDTLGID